MTNQHRVHPAAGSRPGPPAVVFVDDLRWDAFAQLSPRLRRAGLRTVRVSTEDGRSSNLASRLLFDRYEAADASSAGRILREVFATENVVDVQFVEPLGELVRSCMDVLPPEVVETLGARLAAIDKVGTSQRLQRAGVRTPDLALVDSMRATDAASHFGFPLVTKRRVGCGGDHVHFARSADELALIEAAWGGDRSDRYYERFIVGEKLNYSAAVGPAGVTHEATYRVSRWIQPAGTATEIETLADSGLADLGRRTAGVLGLQGLVNLDVIRDPEGRDWVLDVNARAFGGLANFLRLGVDFADGYLVSLGLRAAPTTPCTAPPDRRVVLFPANLGDPRYRSSLVKMTFAFVRGSCPYAFRLGLRYWLSELLRAPDAATAVRRGRGATGVTGGDADTATSHRVLSP